ncbi:MAG: CSLREA domain-containing protein [Oscillochloris sp.]|nr:CSLREA domain-containing protein [Oscillochloris sp.]
MENGPRAATPTLLLALIMVLSTLVIPTTPTHAATTLTVTTTADTIASDGACSLREAITAANKNQSIKECSHAGGGGLDTIRFAIPGAGPHTINLSGQLPKISDDVLIDGWSQAGAGVGLPPQIVLNGTTAPHGSDAIRFGSGANHSTFQGIAIDGLRATSGGSGGYAVIIEASRVTLRGNYIGLLPDGGGHGNDGCGVTVYGADNVVEGNLIAGNGIDGVYLFGAGHRVENNVIGLAPDGTPRGNDNIGLFLDSASTPFLVQNNVISANGSHGVFATNGTRATLVGNRIGTDVIGLATRGNGGDGIRSADGDELTIGGNSASEANIIGGNHGAGIRVIRLHGGTISGNAIGVDLSGQTGLPNGGDGIRVGLKMGHVPINNNRIGFNNGDGILVQAGVGRTMRGNLIADNTGLPISLAGNPALIDLQDQDGGGTIANGLQNPPIILSASSNDEGPTTILGLLHSTPEQDFAIDLFGAANCTPTGFGQSSELLGVVNVSTNMIGTAYFSATVTPAIDTRFISATATGFEGTSPFSRCMAAGPDNIAWVTAYELGLPGIDDGRPRSIEQFLTQAGQARWYKFAVRPDTQVQISLSNLPADYDLTVYRDIGQAYDELTSPEDLPRLDAEFAPDFFTPDFFTPDFFTPDFFTDEAYSSAQVRSLIAIRGDESTADRNLTINTWSNTGEFYIRVRGTNGVYDPSNPFRIAINAAQIACPAAELTTASTLTLQNAPAAWSGGFQSIILYDSSRLTMSQTLRDRIGELAALDSVRGVAIDLSEDARIVAANQLADANPACSFLKNQVGYTIKDVIDQYRDSNTAMRYVVLVGDDEVIPFFRYPDRAELANENRFFPPLEDLTAANAALRNSYMLGQDFYGARFSIARKSSDLPILELPVGRLVESEDEIRTLLDAYIDGTQNGVLPAPTTALTAGYEFLSDTTAAVRDSLQGSMGGNATINSLIAPRDCAPSDATCTWSADDLRRLLLEQRNDLVFLAGHFSQSSALAADYASRLTTSDLLASPVDLTNTIIWSNGCHSGYSLDDGSALQGQPNAPDWAQAFARKGVTWIGGTGYQYGDTDIIAYSEQLYLNFTQRLAGGGEPVALGDALMRAKQDYLVNNVGTTDSLSDKSYIIATLFGLPMLRVNLPGPALSETPQASLVSGLDSYADGPGAALNLRATDLSLPQEGDPPLSTLSDPITLANSENPDASVQARYLIGKDGISVAPGRPVLPLNIYPAGAPDGSYLRGVAFRGGSYEDLAGFRALTGAAATELSLARAIFRSDYLFPPTFWSINHFAELNDPLNGQPLLNLTPAQYISEGPLGANSETGILRRFTNVDLRLYYSSFAETTPGGNNPALSAAPFITNVRAEANDGLITFSAEIVGSPSAGIVEAWVVYSDGDGQWLPRDLQQDASDSRRWFATASLADLGLEDAADLRFMVQAVNGVGIVGSGLNQGRYYEVGASPTDLLLNRAAAAITITPVGPFSYDSSANFSASLRDSVSGDPITDAVLTFSLNGQSRRATVDASGTASTSIRTRDLPGSYTLRVGFVGDANYAPANAELTFSVTERRVALDLQPAAASVLEGEDSGITATLRDTFADVPLFDKPVLFVVSAEGSSYSTTVQTAFDGRAALGIVPLPPGIYTVAAYFNSAPEAMNAFMDPRYGTATALGTLEILSPNLPPETTIDSAPPAISGPQVSFSFSGSDDRTPAEALGFVCALDSGAFAGCNSPQQYVELAEGPHRFEVAAIDAEELVDPTPAVYEWTVDATPPEVTATVRGIKLPHCPATCYLNQARITLSASDNLAGVGAIRYRIGDGLWQIYSGRITISAIGFTTIYFLAEDSVGNVSAEQQLTIHITDLDTRRILDAFNRSNGKLGANWIWAAEQDQYRIQRKQVLVVKGGPLAWGATTFGATQEAFITLSEVVPGGRHHSLMLKASGHDASAGAILVFYDDAAQQVKVEVLVPGYGWSVIGAVDATMNDGDLLGARANADGSVHVYVRCERVATFDTRPAAGDHYVGSGGKIGVWYFETGDARFDNFGGGDITP